MIFDTRLFEKNDPNLAKQVKVLAKYFKGNGVIRISWIEAKFLVKRSRTIIYELTLFNKTVTEHEDKNYYDYYIMLALNNFRVWNYYKVIRKANMFFDKIPRVRMARIVTTQL